MNLKQLLQRFHMYEPIVYVRDWGGQWVPHDHEPSHYSILEVEERGESLEVLALDMFVAMSVCRDINELEDARPYAVKLLIKSS